MLNNERKEQIIRELRELNSTIDRAPANPARQYPTVHPARTNYDVIVEFLSAKERKEVISLVGEWNAKKWNKKNDKLIQERIKLEQELKTLL